MELSVSWGLCFSCLYNKDRRQRSGNFLPYQYSVTVNDRVEPVSDGEDGTLLKLVPDSLLDEAVSSKGEREHNTLAQKLSSYRAWGRDFTQSRTMAHQK